MLYIMGNKYLQFYAEVFCLSMERVMFGWPLLYFEELSVIIFNTHQISITED